MTTRLCWLCGALLLAAAGTSRADVPGTNAAPAESPAPTAADLVEKANSDEADGKLDIAIQEASSALDLDPKNAVALDLRGSIYIQQKLYDRAERDYSRAYEISPDPTYQYKLGEIKFVQREYDDARPFYAKLKDDPHLGDLARFKIFVCDLFGSHEAIAARDLTLLDATGRKPSYYFGRAAWASYHRDSSQANRLVAQATGRFDGNLCDLYRKAFTDMRLFKLSQATFVTKDGRHLNNSSIFLENDGLRVFSGGAWVTLPLDQLPDDLSPFPPDMRERIRMRRDSVVPPVVDTTRLTFTTKSGKTYRQVRGSVADNGLVILTENGWATIPFHDLPDDLSSFPVDVRNQITRARAQDTSGAAFSVNVSFTTRLGKKYEGVRAFPTDDGIAVLTPDGWNTVPYADLPKNLAPFPAAWQKQIRSHLVADTGDDSNTAVISFTTQAGTVYHDVRATLSSDGIMVVTDQGWKTIPFADLPGDLSPFPSSWCTVIQAALQSSSENESGVQVVSFATRRGKSYDQVRASLDDKGVDVLSPNGWVLVSYDQLPDDLSAFPASWRSIIAAREKLSTKPAAAAQP